MKPWKKKSTYRDNKMKQSIIFIILILAMTTPGTAFSNGEQERLDPSAFNMPQRPGSLFSHDDHTQMENISDDCAICHHVYENKTLVPDESSEDNACSDCHSLRPSPENGISLVQAFHKRCKECHYASENGPVLCGQCHIKR